MSTIFQNYLRLTAVKIIWTVTRHCWQLQSLCWRCRTAEYLSQAKKFSEATAHYRKKYFEEKWEKQVVQPATVWHRRMSTHALEKTYSYWLLNTKSLSLVLLSLFLPLLPAPDNAYSLLTPPYQVLNSCSTPTLPGLENAYTLLTDQHKVLNSCTTPSLPVPKNTYTLLAPLYQVLNSCSTIPTLPVPFSSPWEYLYLTDSPIPSAQFLFHTQSSCPLFWHYSVALKTYFWFCDQGLSWQCWGSMPTKSASIKLELATRKVNHLPTYYLNQFAFS